MFFRETACRLLCDSLLPLVAEAPEVPLEGDADDEKLKELECTDAADVATKPAAILSGLLLWLVWPRWWPPLLTFGF